jgi:hypothetical protein
MAGQVDQLMARHMVVKMTLIMVSLMVRQTAVETSLIMVSSMMVKTVAKTAPDTYLIMVSIASQLTTLQTT